MRTWSGLKKNFRRVPQSNLSNLGAGECQYLMWTLRLRLGPGDKGTLSELETIERLASIRVERGGVRPIDRGGR